MILYSENDDLQSIDFNEKLQKWTKTKTRNKF